MLFLFRKNLVRLIQAPVTQVFRPAFRNQAIVLHLQMWRKIKICPRKTFLFILFVSLQYAGNSIKTALPSCLDIRLSASPLKACSLSSTRYYVIHPVLHPMTYQFRIFLLKSNKPRPNAAIVPDTLSLFCKSGSASSMLLWLLLLLLLLPLEYMTVM